MSISESDAALISDFYNLDAEEPIKPAFDTGPFKNHTGYTQNDSGNAQRFVDRCGKSLRYVPAWGQWLVWNGQRWVVDDSAAIMRLAREHAHEVQKEAAAEPDEDRRKRALSAAITLGNARKLSAMLDLARSDQRVIVLHADLDSAPFLLGVQNGIVDLRTGKFRAGQKEDNVTKCSGTAYEGAASCPQWDEFLRVVLNGDAEQIRYIQKAVGYTLTGSIQEHCFFFLFGGGCNGKSTFVETIQALLGDYGQRGSQTLFTARVNAAEPSNEIARLPGARLVVGSETEDGSRWAESRMKDLTGGDTLTGRRLYHESFDFKPQMKIWLFGNHKPTVGGTDEGIWRRVRLLPFVVQISNEQIDPELPRKLADELPGILNWAIQGCRLWQEEGLKSPRRVREATAEYRDEEDYMGEFLQEETTSGPDDSHRIERNELYSTYREWADRQGIKYQFTSRTFYKKIRERAELGESKSNGVRFITGIKLKPPFAATRVTVDDF